MVNAFDLFDKGSMKDGCFKKTALGSDIVSSSADHISLGPEGLEEGELACSPVISPDRKPSWSSVVAKGPPKSGLVLEYFPPAPPLLEDGPITIKPPAEVLQKGNNLWNNCLVGSFIHSRLPFKLVEESVQKLWGSLGLQKVFLQDKGYFIFKFSNPEERDNVLALGPWYISNKLIYLKHWKEGLDFVSDACSKTPVWVKFHNVPLSYLTASGLSYLASGIGKPLFVDKVTEKLEPMTFARMCVEISTSTALPSSLDVVILDEETKSEKLVSVKVEYQNKPLSCSHCKTFGHSLLRCPQANYKWVPKLVPIAPERAPLVEVHSDAPEMSPAGEKDSWTLVAKGPKLQVVLDPPSPTPNLFNLLSTSAVGLQDSFSDTDVTPSPNPLVGKLKLIDEKEVKDLKQKAKCSLEVCQASKKKIKGGGSKKSPT